MMETIPSTLMMVGGIVLLVYAVAPKGAVEKILAAIANLFKGDDGRVNTIDEKDLPPKLRAVEKDMAKRAIELLHLRDYILAVNGDKEAKKFTDQYAPIIFAPPPPVGNIIEGEVNSVRKLEGGDRAN